MTAKAKGSGNKKDSSSEVWSKIKYDRQIVAIGIIKRASKIYTDDVGLSPTAARRGITPVTITSLPIPSEKSQMD